jgi:DNA gyrase subunit A
MRRALARSQLLPSLGLARSGSPAARVALWSGTFAAAILGLLSAGRMSAPTINCEGLQTVPPKNNNNDRIEFEESIVQRPIVVEMESSFLDYAMSVIVSRALPDARDGLKPIHRRILWAMLDGGYTSDKGTSKAVGVVADVMKFYHPHGDQAVYDSLVRLAQDWSLRYPLVHPQGNFGSIDGDPPAAMRYTECRLRPLGEYLLEDIKKETVDWTPNFDGNKLEPTLITAPLPNLLMNGSEGIAVGMATRIPPHNLRELTSATLALMDNKDISIEELVQLVPGPDFPTAGMLLGNAGAVEAYKTGKGSVTLRGRAEIEEDDKGRLRIVVTEIPYQVNKSTLIEKIAQLALAKRLDNVRDVRDESDKSGIRIVVELGPQAQPQMILNNLYKQTQLQINYSLNMLALRDGVPRLMGLKELLQIFIDHRRDVVTRRSIFEKRKAEERAHILEGLLIAQANIEEVVRLIRASKDTAAAKAGLIEKFALSEAQAQAILDMRLSQLTSLEIGKIEDELKALQKRIAELEAILASPKKLDGVIRSELEEATAKYGDERRTTIAHAVGDDGSFAEEDLIRREDVVVSLTRAGYIKRIPASTYRAQGRGGKGLIGQKTKAEDVVHHLIHTNTHDTLLCFTNRGAVYSVKVYRIPQYDRAAKGQPVVNLLSLQPNEQITSIVCVTNFDHPYLFMCTQLGTVKRCALKEFAQLRVTGKRAINLGEGDQLDFVIPTTGTDQVLITTARGMAVKFDEEQVRVMGVAAAGVRGVNLQGKDDRVVGLTCASDDEDLLVVGENGVGKRSKVELFRKTARGAKGVIAIKVGEKTGAVVGAKKVVDSDELLIITTSGMIIRTQVAQIRGMGRATQGVKLMNLRESDAVSDIEVISASDQEEGLFDGDEG